MKRVTWRLWAVIGAVVAAYGVAAVWFATAGTEYHIYTWGLVAATVAPVMMTAGYTVATRGGWLSNDLGVNLVMTQVGIIPFAGILAWTFLFHHGALTSTAQAWAEVGSPWWTAAWLTWRNVIFYRIYREKEGTKDAARH